ncbi:hypothetical protein KSC_078330 [Ktedonobacter sp. SOSP1-52]|nr:hypothetical protein KSC_078330 [Ktedonobacter sp. SOSP1-52]
MENTPQASHHHLSSPPVPVSIKKNVHAWLFHFPLSPISIYLAQIDSGIPIRTPGAGTFATPHQSPPPGT